MGDEIEEVIKFYKSRKPYLPIYLMVLGLIVVITYLKIYNMPLDTLTLFGALLFTMASISITEIHRIRDTYSISDNHVIHRSGYLAKAEKKIHLKSITDIEARQGIWQRLVGYGSIFVQSASGSNHILIKDINRPEKFISLLETKTKRIEDLM
jgi:uncharacterized membrane protein YdbT with pleckstrin-like domain